MLFKNHKYQHKVNAFTITEIVVVLAISAILSGLAFSVITVVKKNKLNIEKNYNYTEEINLLKLALQIDVNKHTKMEWLNQKNELLFTSPIDTVSYYFSGDSIYSSISTFKIKATDKQFFFKGETTENGKIDAIKLTFDAKNFFIYKNPDTSTHF